MLRRVPFTAFAFLLATVVWSFSQQLPGTPPFNSFQSVPGGLVVNLGSLDVHASVPIRSKAGLIPFASNLNYDNEFWYPRYGTWAGSPGFLFYAKPNGGSPATYNQTHVTTSCGYGATEYYNFSYIDFNGTQHSVPSMILEYPSCDYPSNDTGTSADGYQISPTAEANNVVSATVTDPDGNVVTGKSNASNSGTFTDRNGNTITEASGVYTDTLGTTALTTVFGGNPTTFSYVGESGNNETVSESFTGYYLASAFAAGCSGTTDYVGTSLYYLPTTFSLPDGSSYAVKYEQTPGRPSGYVTGRIASITLPTGGKISFSYNGINNGMNCDGTTSGMTMTTPDGTWTYTHSAPNSNHVALTTVTDPAGNVANYWFYVNSSLGDLEIQRQVYTGSTTLLYTLVTCYNGQTSNCATAPNSISAITSTAKTYIAANNTQYKTVTNYDSYERLTEEDDYDWGTGSPQPSMYRQTFWVYGSYNNGNCNALSGNILDAVCKLIVYDSANGNAVDTYKFYIRDTKGNVTNAAQQVNGSYSLYKLYSYNSNGTVATFTDVNDDPYSYTYGDCNGALPTSISEPASLSELMTWNCTGGVLTSVTDEASGTTNIHYGSANSSDPNQYFWRPSSVLDAMSNKTSFSYSPTTQESTLNFGSSTVDKLVTLDSLGREQVSQQRQALGSPYFDSVETDYNSDGLISRVTQPYQGTAGGTNSSAPATTYAYDGAGRILTITTDGGLGQVSYSVNGPYVTKTVSGQPSGESTKQWQYFFNSMGWLRVVCEVTGNSSDPTCSTTGSSHGYQTQYNLDAAGRILSMTENNSGTGQNRSWSYDELGRITSETNPESGTTSYTYDKSQTGAGAGDLYTKTDANTAPNVTITYTYGAFHRLLTANAGGSYCRNFVYDAVSGGPTGQNYIKGRLAEAYTDQCGSNTQTKEYLGYDADGHTTDLWESTPNSGGLYHVTDQYYPNDVVNTLIGDQANGNPIGGLPMITYQVDGEGRPTTVSATSGPNPVVTAASYYTTSGTGQSIGQFAGLTFGSSDSANYQYDPSTGRMTQYTFSINSSNVVGALTWNPNGTLQKLAITDPFNSSDSQTCTYSYDGIARLTQVSCPTIWGQNFTYDAFGNLTKTVISGDGGQSWQPGYNTNNQYTLTGVHYDKDGNLTNDTFNSYSWSAFGEVTAIGSQTVTHDAFGRVAEYVNGSTIRQLLYAPSGAKIAKMNGQTLDTAWVPLPGGAIADYHAGGFNAYGYADWLGTTRLGSTSSRTKDADWAVAPYGEVYASGSSPSYGVFTGNGNFDVLNNKMWDFSMREQHSSQGRWISPDPAGVAAVDPINPQTWNRYAYVGSNPLAIVDPSGLAGPRGCGGDIGFTCGSPALLGSSQDCAISIDGGGDIPCGLGMALLGGSFESVLNLNICNFLSCTHFQQSPYGQWYEVPNGDSENTSSWLAVPDPRFSTSNDCQAPFICNPTAVVKLPPPPPPKPPGNYGLYLICVGEGFLQGVSDSANVLTTIAVNGAPAVFAETGQARKAVIGLGAAAIFDWSKAFALRQQCTYDVYHRGAPVNSGPGGG